MLRLAFVPDRRNRQGSLAARINNADDGGRPAPQKRDSKKTGTKAPTFSITDTTQFKRAIDMTDDELAAIASRATLHVATETPEELYYDKKRLLANGDRWERAIAKNISLDAPYR